MEHVIIIPALEPDQKLITLIDELNQMREGRVVVVDDGSGEAAAHIFRRLGDYPNVTVLRHDTNQGKGAALKTAFAYCARNFTDISGAVTADCDGQHKPRDILRVSRELICHPDCLILGVRDFANANTPVRSLIGNRLTSLLFYLLYRQYLPDTQTGLRGIPAAKLGWLANLSGQRYDYELNMLIQAKRLNINIIQVPIEIIYFDNNSRSHYRMVPDSARNAKSLFFNLFSDKNGARENGGKRFYGSLFYFCRRIVRLFSRRLKVAGELPAGPSVFVGHHRNLKGVIRVLLWFEMPVRVWALWCFCDKEACYRQYADYTFSKRTGWNKAAARVIARALSPFVARLLRSARAVPVYRDSVRGLKLTFQESVEALCRGESLLIFPDIDYASESEQIGDIYSGFIALDRFYAARTGGHIGFTPIKADMDKREIRVGSPSRLADGENFARGRNRVSAELREKIDAL